MAVVIESKSSWTPEQVDGMVARANNILAQCEILVKLQSQIALYLGTLAMDYDSVGLANEFYAQFQKPVMFFIEGTQYNGSAGWAPGSRYLFISSYSQTQEYKDGRRAEYEILAHELGHMLGRLQHLSGGEQNLMAGYVADQTAELTEEQCTSLRASRHLTPHFEAENFAADLYF